MAADKARDEQVRREARKAAMPTHIREAHKHSIRNASEIGRSDSCGCFYCLATFAPSEIAEWIEECEEVCESDAVSQIRDRANVRAAGSIRLSDRRPDFRSTSSFFKP